MANHITKMEREKLIAHAASLIVMNPTTMTVTNYDRIVAELMKTHNISRQRATNAIGTATRRLRYAIAQHLDAMSKSTQANPEIR